MFCPMQFAHCPMKGPPDGCGWWHRVELGDNLTLERCAIVSLADSQHFIAEKLGDSGAL
jgi:hypothetical protein